MDMIIIAGFLGSGKTTLILNTVGQITERTGKKVAMIVNDFGNIGIDGKVMEKYGLKVQELPSGCICCTLGPNFLDTVRTIHDKFQPDLVIVEPSGIADPDSILATMEHYQGRPLGKISTVILLDAVRFPLLVQAMRIRGFQPHTNLHTYRSYAYLAAMLLVRSFDRAESVYQAMLCRGLHGTFYSLKTFSWQRRDGIFVMISLLALTVILCLEWQGRGLF